MKDRKKNMAIRDSDKLETLLQKYPHLFPKHPETQEPCFYFQCGDGWYSLISTLLLMVDGKIQHWERYKKEEQKHLADGTEIPSYVVKKLEANPTSPLETWSLDQVKEKFGGLRFYCSYIDEEFQGAIAFAEAISTTICEVCGNTGKLYPRGWMTTRCEAHVPDYAKPSAQVSAANSQEEESEAPTAAIYEDPPDDYIPEVSLED